MGNFRPDQKTDALRTTLSNPCSWMKTGIFRLRLSRVCYKGSSDNKSALVQMMAWHQRTRKRQYVILGFQHYICLCIWNIHCNLNSQYDTRGLPYWSRDKSTAICAEIAEFDLNATKVYFHGSIEQNCSIGSDYGLVANRRHRPLYESLVVLFIDPYMRHSASMGSLLST